tara:strand:- start:751 stop:1227 length:477 start_codon:yes stop_codon:yes gene_type:complete
MKKGILAYLALVFAFVFPPIGIVLSIVALQKCKSRAIPVAALVFSSIFFIVYILFLVPIFAGLDKELVLNGCEVYCNVETFEDELGKDFTYELARYGIESCEDFVLEYYPEKFEEFELNCHRENEGGIYEDVQDVVEGDLDNVEFRFDHEAFLAANLS